MVTTGNERRRRWSDEERARILRRSRRPARSLRKLGGARMSARALSIAGGRKRGKRRRFLASRPC